MTMQIGDELRANASTAWLNHMADRIDSEMVELPKDREGQTLHIGDEVLVFNGTEPVGQGEVTGMTPV